MWNKVVTSTTSLSAISLNFFKSTGTVFNLPTSKSFTFVYKLFKLVRTLTNLLMSSLSTSAFQAAKSFVEAKSDVSILVTWSNSF